MVNLIIDTPGGSNFAGNHLRNVSSLHVGGAGLAAPFTLQVTGTANITGAVTSAAGFTGPMTPTGNFTVTGNLTVTGTSTLTGAVTSGLINGQTISSAANFTGTVATGAITATVTGALPTVLKLINTTAVASGMDFNLASAPVGNLAAGDAWALSTGGNLLLSTNTAGKSVKIVGGVWTDTVGLTIGPAGVVTFGGTIAGSIVATSVGPHAIGGITQPNFALRLTGTLAAAGALVGLYVDHTHTLAAGADGYGAIITPTFTEAASGNHGLLTSLRVSAPTITAGAATVSIASTLYIDTAPTAGVGNYSIYVVSGASKFGGDIIASVIRRDTADGADNSYTAITGGGALAVSRGGLAVFYGNEAANPGMVSIQAGSVAGATIQLVGDTSTLGTHTVTGDVIASVIRRGTADGADNSSLGISGGGAVSSARGASIQLFGNESGLPGDIYLDAGELGNILFRTSTTVERGRITSGGILAWGTILVTGAVAGEIVLANSASIRFVTAASTTTFSVLTMDSSNRTTLNLNSQYLSNINALTATTVGGAGGASALPATPLGYWRIMVNATAVKIPYYIE